MKYIRTEKGVYEFTDEMCINQFGHIAYKDRPFICVYGVGNEVIAQSDTIEELCDEFVCVSKDNPKSYIIDDNLWGDVYPYYDSEKDYLFGAIWTSKGLIYVAKMNDKGELELI